MSTPLHALPPSRWLLDGREWDECPQTVMPPGERSSEQDALF